MKSNIENKILSFQLPKVMDDALGKIANDKDRPKAYILRDIIEQYIEDYADVQKAEKVLKNLEDEKTYTVSWEEVQKKSGLL